MEAKICGVKDKKILNFIVSHKYAPKFIGFICNYPKSHRNLSLEKLKTLLNVKKHKSNFVAVLVSPNLNYLKKIARFNFDFFQLYNVSPKKTLIIKKKFKKKIISVIQVSKPIGISTLMFFKLFLCALNILIIFSSLILVLVFGTAISISLEIYFPV